LGITSEVVEIAGGHTYVQGEMEVSVRATLTVLMNNSSLKI
jgi:hypothetical protein